MKYFALVTRESSPGSGVAVKEEGNSVSFRVVLLRTSLDVSEEKSLSQ